MARPSSPGPIYRNARRGIGFVPQGHNVFRDLSVAQNLKMAGLLHDQAYIAEVYRLFPVLMERRPQIAGSLSGGQQQMLAVGMALMTQPTILMLDEPTTGLAPIIVQDMFRTLLEINRTIGTAIVLVEQNVAAALRMVERAVVTEDRRDHIRRTQCRPRSARRSLALVLTLADLRTGIGGTSLPSSPGP